MRAFLLLVVCSVWLCIALPSTLLAQKANSEVASYNRYDLFGGYSFLSNSFARPSGETSLVPLNGWDAGLAFRAWHQLDANRPWHRLGIKTDVSGYYGTSLNSPQRPIFLLVGPQYTWPLGKNSLFVEGQVGFGHMNNNWNPFNLAATDNSFAAFVGGGFDHPIASRLAFRVEGGMLYTNFSFSNDESLDFPNYFARISTGLVWHF
jgi:hypothetical protein